MLATREQAHNNRLPRLESKYRKNLNPVAAIFGANASGKSTLVKALETFRDLLVGQGSDQDKSGKFLPYDPFLLDSKYSNSETKFELLFAYKDYVYEYSISYKRKSIIEEKLIKILSSSEVKIFERNLENVWVNPRNISDTAKIRLDAISSTVPDTVPVSTHFYNINKNRFDEIREIISEACAPTIWCGNMLVISAGAFDQKKYGSNFAEWTKGIEQIDAGIAGVERTPLDSSSIKSLQEEFPVLVEKTLKYGRMEIDLLDTRYDLKYENDELSVDKIELKHDSLNGAKPLPWGDESDGTKSAAQLISVFSQCAKANSVLIVDEIDRSFHTELSRALVDGFLKSISPESRNQLIFTTHDLLLMDPSRLRRDEMWIAEKDKIGQSQLKNLSEYEGVRKDKDIRKSYLQGRFGGVPNIEPIKFGELNIQDRVY